MAAEGEILFRIAAAGECWYGLGVGVTWRKRRRMVLTVRLAGFNPAELPASGLSVFARDGGPVGLEGGWQVDKLTQDGTARVVVLSAEAQPPGRSRRRR